LLIDVRNLELEFDEDVGYEINQWLGERKGLPSCLDRRCPDTARYFR